MTLRCRACAHQDHKHCEGTPEQNTCHCRQCWTRHIMAMAEQYMDGNNHAMVRTALKAIWALQLQTQLQRQRNAYRQPVTLYCASCGKPVPVLRRPKLGQPVYCRGKSTCKTRAFKRRAVQEARKGTGTGTASQIPEFSVEEASVQVREPSPAELWLAMRAG